MAKKPQNAAASKAAATSSPPPAAPPAGPASDAAEATASSNGASETTAAAAGDLTPAGGGQAAPGERVELFVSTVLPEVIDLGHGVTIAQADLISAAAPELTSSAAEWNALPEADRNGLIDQAVEAAREQVARAAASGVDLDQADKPAPGADLNEAGYRAAHEAIRLSMEETGIPLRASEPLFIGADFASQSDRVVKAVQSSDGRIWFDELATVLNLGEGVALTLGEFFELPQAHQADVITMLVKAAAWSSDDAGELADDLVASGQLAEPPPGFLWVRGKSRDGGPFRRAGIVWDANFQHHLVDEIQFEKLVRDPHLIVEF